MKPAPPIATWLLERSCSDVQHEFVTGEFWSSITSVAAGAGTGGKSYSLCWSEFVRQSTSPPASPHVRVSSTRTIGSTEFFSHGANRRNGYHRSPLKLGIPILFAIFFSFLGAEIVRFWYKLHPPTQGLDLTNRKQREPLFTPVIARPVGPPEVRRHND